MRNQTALVLDLTGIVIVFAGFLFPPIYEVIVNNEFGGVGQGFSGLQYLGIVVASFAIGFIFKGFAELIEFTQKNSDDTHELLNFIKENENEPKNISVPRTSVASGEDIEMDLEKRS